MSENRNFLLAAVLSMAVLLGWQYFFIEPQVEAERAVQIERSATDEALADSAIPQVLESRPNSPADLVGEGTLLTGLPRDLALSQSERVQIDTDLLAGSISLTGARIDDLQLHTYHETVDPTSPEIVLFSPANSISPYFAEFGWTAPKAAGLKLPGRNTVWTAPAGASLSANSSVTFAHDNGEGLVFNRTVTVDENYMFTIEQNVANNTGAPVTLYPYGLVSRTGTPEVEGFFILHEGLIGMLGEEGLVEIDYDDIQGEPEVKHTTTEGWLGITDKYWATVLIPERGRKFDARFSEDPNPRKNVYQTDYLGVDGVTAAPGTTISHTAQLYAGAKVVDMIDGYEAEGVFRFEFMIDWGWFSYLTKPLFIGLDYVYGLVGNFGIAILIVTVIIKLFFFPLANRSYEAMSKMKKLQPNMEKLREQYADDKMEQQKQIMELYKKEKVNPLAGCLPVVIQIPVFFALYKVLFVTIEMRHAPFYGWIQDLSAPDPTTLFNLFGLIPWDPPSLLMVGVWPLLMGITMFVQQRMNPAPADPTQQMIFTWMPVFFVFILASFPAGLVIYWAWNNLLSVLQQGVIMRRQGVAIELFSNMGFEKLFKRSPPKDET
jgi:YidC/Oxa1 family membrane protein insertase